MDSAELKLVILENDYIEDILDSLGCHHIHRNSTGYIQCANPDGDNKGAVIVYLNDNLTVVNYTRQLSKDKRTHDIFDLIMFYEDMTFPEAMKWVCDQFGINYYAQKEEIPESLELLKLIGKMCSGYDGEDNSPLEPIDPSIMDCFLHYPNEMFEQDGISLEVQEEFEIGYDPLTNRIVIPIKDAIGSIVGLKGRLYTTDMSLTNRPKYLYLERCNKAKLLYGYYENERFIKNSDVIYIFEAEKSVMQCATQGIRNCVATAGKTISKAQVELITRTGCTPVFCFDKDVSFDELASIADMFIEGISVYTIYDENDLLDDKQSPSDDPKKFEILRKDLVMLK